MILGYWEIPGKCQVIRFILEMVKAQYTEKRYTFKNSSDWFEQDKVSLGFDFPNLPYLIDGDIKLTESNAIVSYILDKYDKTEWKGKKNDFYKVEELRFLFTDLQSLGYLSSKGEEQSFIQFLEKIKKVYDFMKIDQKFLLGYFTVADLYSWESIIRLKIQYPEKYKLYADKFDIQIQNIENIPEIKAYIQSGRCLQIAPLKN